MNVAMIGVGYVGLVSGTCLAEIGHNVTCVDIDPNKIDMLNAGRSPIYEPGLDEMIQRNAKQNRLTFTTELAEALKTANIVFIAVGTPEGPDGSAKLDYVKAAAVSIGEIMNQDSIVVVKSTVPVGTCDLVKEIITDTLDNRGVDFDVSIVSNPEFLKEGSAIIDFMKPDRIIVGVEDKKSEDAMSKLYHVFSLRDNNKLRFMTRRSSVLTKYAANAMLAIRISFMNELSALCEEVGANVDDIRRGMGSDPRIGAKFLYAGPGYGGSCFPKDVSALLKIHEQYNTSNTVLKAVMAANDHQKERVSQKFKQHFGDLKGLKICIWGLAFKPGTDDVRESPAKTIIENLVSWGATVVAHDPEGQSNFASDMAHLGEAVTYVDSMEEAITDVDAITLVTEWGEYRQPEWETLEEKMKQKVVFDLRNQYNQQELESKGFVYHCVGR